MELARIAELLEPFLEAHYASTSSDHCHSEERSAKACPERSRRESAALSPAQLQNISTYIDILLRWNARINLTAIRDPEQIVTRHFGESLFAARHLFPATGSAAERRQNAAHGVSRGSVPPTQQAPEGRKTPASTEAYQHSYQPAASSRGRESSQNERALAPAGVANNQRPAAHRRISLADVGSGAGFPGIPIKLWAPQISLTLIESNHKKATFLREVARALTLTDINIQATRAENLLEKNLLKQDLVDQGIANQDPTKAAQPDRRPHFDVVTLRAVERFPDILPVSAALVAPGGRLALLIGSSQQAHVHASLPAFHWFPPAPVPLSTSRTLLIGTREPQEQNVDQ